MNRLLLLSALLLVTVACKNINTSAGPAKLAFNNASYMIVRHDQDQSLLRRKLLNLALTKKLNLKDETTINEDDEFNLIDNVYYLNKGEKEEYESLKSTSAELIVSYRDRQEIYFVPTGILRDNALSQIHLTPDKDQRFIWITDETILLKGHTYYLLSTTNDLIKKNDVHNFHETLDLKNNFKGSILRVAAHQSLDIALDGNVIVKQTQYVMRKGRTRSCPPKMHEEGCPICEYRIEAVSGNKTRAFEPAADSLPFLVIIDGAVHTLSEFKTSIRSNRLIVHVEPSQYSQNSFSKVEFSISALENIFRNVKSVETGEWCAARDLSETLDLTPQLDIQAKVQVNGRSVSF